MAISLHNVFFRAVVPDTHAHILPRPHGKLGDAGAVKFAHKTLFRVQPHVCPCNVRAVTSILAVLVAVFVVALIAAVLVLVLIVVLAHLKSLPSMLLLLAFFRSIMQFFYKSVLSPLNNKNIGSFS